MRQELSGSGLHVMDPEPKLEMVKPDDNRPPAAPTGGNGGGGHRLSEVERRIGKVEDSLAEQQKTLGEINVTLAEINVKLDDMATEKWVYKLALYVTGGFLLIIATVVQILLHFLGT